MEKAFLSVREHREYRICTVRESCYNIQCNVTRREYNDAGLLITVAAGVTLGVFLGGITLFIIAWRVNRYT